jgi:hypothetical protein
MNRRSFLTRSIAAAITPLLPSVALASATEVAPVISTKVGYLRTYQTQALLAMYLATSPIMLGDIVGLGKTGYVQSVRLNPGTHPVGTAVRVDPSISAVEVLLGNENSFTRHYGR